MCWAYKAASPGLSMVIWQGRKIAALVQLWSVTMRIELYSPDLGKFTIKSIATVLKGRAVLWVVMGKGGILGCVVLLLVT
jgi:hypothetical protein